MNNRYKISIVIAGIVVSTAFYSNYRITMNLTDTLEQEKIVTADLKNNITLLNTENSVLTKKLNGQVQGDSKKNPEINSQQSVNTTNGSDITLKKDSLTKDALDNNSKLPETNPTDSIIPDAVDNRVVDINAVFQGIDPSSDAQQEKYVSFKNEIESYQFNERFDLRSFMSDPRFSELHASLGVQIMDYVDKQLQGVALMQDNPEGAAMLTEIDH